MKIQALKALQPYREPPPPEKKTCAACKSFAPECLVPVGELAVAMCWLCAHHVVEHDASIGDAPAGRCSCLPHDIYPGRKPAEAPPAEPEVNPREIERAKLFSSPEKLKAWAIEAHKQMSLAQHAAVKRRLG